MPSDEYTYEYSYESYDSSKDGSVVKKKGSKGTSSNNRKSGSRGTKNRSSSKSKRAKSSNSKNDNNKKSTSKTKTSKKVAGAGQSSSSSSSSSDSSSDSHESSGTSDETSDSSSDTSSVSGTMDSSGSSDSDSGSGTSDSDSYYYSSSDDSGHRKKGGKHSDEQPIIDLLGSIAKRKVSANPVQLSWKDITYDVSDRGAAERKKKAESHNLHSNNNNINNNNNNNIDNNKSSRPANIPEGRKRVLHSISGHAEPGTFTAILGPSGAGKTSLLRIIAGKINRQEYRGDVCLNARVASSNDFHAASAFVAQDDVLMGSLTVREAFRFAAKLRRRVGETEEEMEARVDTLVHDLGLTTCVDTLIGYTGQAAQNSGVKRGISGGERKRVSIGLELLTEPQLLCLDEPTSGLDAYSAKSTCLHLAKLARQGRTVVATIHQPSSTMFRMFDRLILLAEGRTLYNGPATKATEYFATHGYVCPVHRNPADYFLKILFVGDKDIESRMTPGETPLRDHKDKDILMLEDTDKAQVAKLAGMYDESKFKIKYETIPPPPRSANENGIVVRPYAASYFTQFAEVAKRSMRNIAREPLLGGARLMQAVVLGIMFGLVFLQLGRDQVGMQDRVGSLFFIVITQAFGSMNGPLFAFAGERAVYYRENSSQMYCTSAYFLGKIVAEFPVNVVIPTLFASITYWLVGFRPEFDAFLVYVGVIILVTQFAWALALVLTTAIKNQAVVLQVQSPVMSIAIFMTGFYVSIDSIPDYISWLGHISFARYGFRAVAINELTGTEFHCSESDAIAPGKECPVTRGEQEIELLGFKGHSIGEDCAVLVGMYAIALILAYIFLRTAKKEF